MPPVRLGPRDLLEYNSTYRLLICRECHYAIQTSALPSHLLKHKIYRQERQRLLSSIAALDLLEPDQVPLPSPTSPPIDDLPVIEGYRCTEEECGNLCASLKRMKGHWGIVHGGGGILNDAEFARPVMLQTFFRGTKIKYFEVTVSDSVGAGPLISTTGVDGESVDKEWQDVEAKIPTPVSRSRGSCPVNLDMETFTYFHHFTTITSLTLPCPTHAQTATHYWQTDFVLLALRDRWLMYGLLAISACHLAVLTDNAAIQKVHRWQSTRLFEEFSLGWEAVAKRDSGIEEEVKISAMQIYYILRCAKWAVDGSTVDQESSTRPPDLQSIIAIFRGFAISDSSLPPDSDAENRQAETFTQANRILKSNNSQPDTEHSDTFPSTSTTPSVVLNRLHDLPSNMATVFGKPERAQDFMATMAAIAALVECCAISFTSDKVSVVWQSMAIWFYKVGDHFNRMVERNSSAALVVAAHWAVVLVVRAEECGCWFLRGAGKGILVQIREVLLSGDCGVLSLIEDLEI